jgi:hypothetical protein
MDDTEFENLTFRGIWKSQEEDGQDLVKSRILVRGRHVRLKRDDDGTCAVLIPVDHSPGWFPEAGDSVSLSCKEWTFPEETGHFVEISCSDPTLHETFDRVASLVVERFSVTGDLATTLRDVFHEYRHLLMKMSGRSNSRATVVGLAGELLFLEKLIPHLSDPLGVREAGTEDQDFHLPGSDIEVKTTSIRGKKMVNINDAQQLFPREHKPLHLCHVKLLEDPGGKSVSDFIEVLVTKGIDRSALMDFCDRAGWNGEDENPIRFLDLGLDFYEVRDGFPRIVPTNFEGGEVPAGVDGIRYQVNLDVAREFRVDGESDEILEGFCSD